MAIKIKCKNNHQIAVAESMQGCTIRCPVCRVKTTIAIMPTQQQQVMQFPPENNYPNSQQEAMDELLSSRDNQPPEEISIQRGHSKYAVTVWLLAMILAALTLIIAAPALKHYNVFLAPNWARALLVLTLIQLTYLGWMAMVPDWSTIWVITWFFGVVTFLYAIIAGMIYSTPPQKLFLLDLYDVRRSAPLWCALAMILMGIATYLSGKISSRLYRQQKGI